ncbi:MAG TPA: BON domain-containing protein, partial [Planctomycetaceae bacterium]|nr:BON domain-containing protein [Planctomycetaceae bacterium]
MLHCPETKPNLRLSNRSHFDIQLALRLEHQLHRELLKSIRVHICGNDLQLFGQVSSWYEKQQAQEAARTVAPMYRIRNELRV